MYSCLILGCERILFDRHLSVKRSKIFVLLFCCFGTSFRGWNLSIMCNRITSNVKCCMFRLTRCAQRLDWAYSAPCSCKNRHLCISQNLIKHVKFMHSWPNVHVMAPPAAELLCILNTLGAWKNRFIMWVIFETIRITQ